MILSYPLDELPTILFLSPSNWQTMRKFPTLMYRNYPNYTVAKRATSRRMNCSGKLISIVFWSNIGIFFVSFFFNLDFNLQSTNFKCMLSRDEIIINAMMRRFDIHSCVVVRHLLKLAFVKSDPWRPTSNPIPMRMIRDSIGNDTNNADAVKHTEHYIRAMGIYF